MNDKSYGTLEIGSRGLSLRGIKTLLSDHMKIPIEAEQFLCIGDGNLAYCPSSMVKSVRIGQEEYL